MSKEVFDSNRGLWLVNKKNELYPNHGSYATQRKGFHNVTAFPNQIHFLEAHSLNWYRFIGRILGKALYDGILVDVAFAGFFLAKVSLLFIGFVLADADATPAVVVGKAEFPRRSCLT